MIGVLSQIIHDYMSAREITNLNFRRLAKKERLKKARLNFIQGYRKLQIHKFIGHKKNLEFGAEELKLFLKILGSYYRLKYRIQKKIRGQKTLGRGRLAEIYLFDDSYESDNYVFGFSYICRYIGLDPKRMRQKIREIKQEQIEGIRKIATKRGKKPG